MSGAVMSECVGRACFWEGAKGGIRPPLSESHPH